MKAKKKSTRSKRVPDGALHAASRDIRTVLRWSALVKKLQELRTSSGHFNDDKHVSYCLTLETDEGECYIRSVTIGKCFTRAAELIHTGEIYELCSGNALLIEGRDF